MFRFFTNFLTITRWSFFLFKEIFNLENEPVNEEFLKKLGEWKDKAMDSLFGKKDKGYKLEEEINRINNLSEIKPVILVMNLKRPSVFTEIANMTQAIVVDFQVQENILLLEDAAHSFGSTLNGKFAGTCASNSPFLQEEGAVCGLCGAKPEEQCKSED